MGGGEKWWRMGIREKRQSWQNRRIGDLGLKIPQTIQSLKKKQRALVNKHCSTSLYLKICTYLSRA